MRILQKGDASDHASIIDADLVVGRVVAVEKRGKEIKLDSLAGRCISILPVATNSLFRRHLYDAFQRDGAGRPVLTLGKCGKIPRWTRIALVLFNRFIIRILFRDRVNCDLHRRV